MNQDTFSMRETLQKPLRWTYLVKLPCRAVGLTLRSYHTVDEGPLIPIGVGGMLLSQKNLYTAPLLTHTRTMWPQVTPKTAVLQVCRTRVKQCSSFYNSFDNLSVATDELSNELLKEYYFSLQDIHYYKSQFILKQLSKMKKLDGIIFSSVQKCTGAPE